jgi:hypothetical protein
MKQNVHLTIFTNIVEAPVHNEIIILCQRTPKFQHNRIWQIHQGTCQILEERLGAKFLKD